MTKRIPMHRGILIAVHLMILATMLTLFFAADSFERAHPAILIAFLILPALVVVLSAIDISRRARIIGYWVLAILMVPLSAIGIFGGYGFLYLIGIIFLLYAAWVENEGRA